MTNTITHILQLILLTTCLFCLGCSDENKNNELKNGNKIDQSSILIDESVINTMNISEEAKKWCLKLYKNKKYKSIWVHSAEIDSSLSLFFNYVNSEVSLNVPIHYFRTPHFVTSNKKVQKEITVALRCAEFLNLKHKSLLNYTKQTLNTSSRVSVADFMRFIEKKPANKSWIDHLIYHQENNTRLVRMHFALNSFLNQYGIENEEEKMPELPIKDSLVYAFTVEKLFKRHFISTKKVDSISLKKQLQNFQYINGLNPDGKLGKYTVSALLETNYSRYLKGILAIDKLRSLPDSLFTSKYIEVNIPGFLMHFYHNNKVINSSRVVVGAKKTKTALFSAPIKYIVTNPYWTVPYSIATKEILVHLKNDSSYLAKKNYELKSNDSLIRPDSIDWKSIHPRQFPYVIRQKPGVSNSLGLIKFMFPNQESIYMHDTPSKHLFKKDQRAFSHGCIRVQNPTQLAEDILLAENHTYKDSIPALLEKTKETYLLLHDSFPVNIVYRTAGISDSTQHIQFYNDIYTREDTLLNLFRNHRRNF